MGVHAGFLCWGRGMRRMLRVMDLETVILMEMGRVIGIGMRRSGRGRSCGSDKDWDGMGYLHGVWILFDMYEIPIVIRLYGVLLSMVDYCLSVLRGFVQLTAPNFGVTIPCRLVRCIY